MDPDDDDYVDRVKSKIIEWKTEEPSVTSVITNTILTPLNWAMKKVIPQKAIQAALNTGDWLAEKAVFDSQIPLPEAGLRARDDLATNVRVWAVGYAVAEGAAAGAVGIISAPVDIPAIVILSLRTIRRVGACYGYSGTSDFERQFVMSVLANAGASTIEEKLSATLALQQMQEMVAKQTFKSMAEKAANSTISKEGAVIAMRKLATQLGFNLTKRRMLSAVPVIGAAIGGSMNGWFIGDVATSAIRSYQERWLIDHDLIIDGMVG